MRKTYAIGILVLFIGLIGFLYVQYRLSAPFLSDDEIAQIGADVAAQDESAITGRHFREASFPPRNPLKNVYFGDLHVHTSLSFDSYLFGNRLTLDQAYRFAKGEALPNPGGEQMRLAAPLDFVAITDHAEGFGLHEVCADPQLSEFGGEFCERMQTPDGGFFLELRQQGEQRPPVSTLSNMLRVGADPSRFAAMTWQAIAAAAEEHNDPGRFTAFAGFEYSPPLPDSGKIHRNVIFRSGDVPNNAVSAFDAATELDLWRQLTEACQQPCEFLTIPHNPNKSWGLAFASHTIDGNAYTAADWRRRSQVEPIVEMFQAKGNSECSRGFGATDEECNFEQFFEPCEDGQETKCIYPTSMARDGLKKGLRLEREIGINPLRFGMIGSTDAHNSNPGDAEEWDFRGVTGLFSSSARRRLDPNLRGNADSLNRNPGGIAAIWAEENTREALFDAMRRKEVYATSGPRIRLRFFGGFEFAPDIARSNDRIAQAYRFGVPMGGVLSANGSVAPSFLIEALRDPDSAPLDRVQIVKLWLDKGEVHEVVWDVACSDGRRANPRTNRCTPTKAAVDLSNCEISKGIGAAQLNTVWTDSSYRKEQKAAYYVRVVENPTCRWSTYDSLRLKRAPPSHAPATVTEMAWSSPIWVG